MLDSEVDCPSHIATSMDGGGNNKSTAVATASQKPSFSSASASASASSSDTVSSSIVAQANGAKHIRWGATTDTRLSSIPYQKPSLSSAALDTPIYTSTIDWEQHIQECDFLYRKQLSQLRKVKKGIKRLAVFDFDNTLFKSPLPNPQLWDSKLIGMLKSTDLGWFQDPRTLSSPYLKCTDSHWISTIERLVHLENKRSDTLVMLLTGRSHLAYRKLILGLISKRKGLHFDIVILKETPTRASPLVSQVDISDSDNNGNNMAPLTFDYKMTVVEDAISAFPGIKEIAMWDDRIYQCEKMQLYLDALQRRRSDHITEACVYHVPPQTIYMNAGDERALILNMIQEYNDRVMGALPQSSTNDAANEPAVGSLQVKEYPSYTGIFLDKKSKQLLLRHVRCPQGWTRAADHMTIALGPAVSERLDKDLGVQLGDHVELAVDTIGTIANAVIAVGVSEIRTQSGPRQPVAEGIPHITIAYNEPAGYRPVYAANIRHWKPLRPEQLVLKGTIREHMLTTASIVRPELKADEVSIGRLVCQFWPNLKGKDIGLAVAEARGRMAKQGVENLEANRGTITDIVRALF